MTAQTTAPRAGHPAALAAAVALLLLGTACDRGKDAEAAGTAAPATVEVGRENIAVARREEIRTGPALSGSLAPEREATIRAEVAGPVLHTYVEAGQRVTEGTVLARLDDASLRDAFLSARSGVTAAQAAYDVARREAERAAKLVEAGAVAERELEAARSAESAARSRLADAQARLALAQDQLDDTQIRAPFAGVVNARQVNAGDVVSPGTALYSVVDPSSMRLEASVSAEQLSAVRVGAPVTFTVSGYPGRTFTGRVTRVNPTADPATRQVRIFASIPNATQNLVAGLFAEGRVASDVHEGVVVPATAVDQRGVTPVAVRIKNGRVERVEVQLGLKDAAAETVEVVSGLTAGDTVLLGAAQGISAGTPVVVHEPTDRAAARAAGPR